MLQVSAWNFQGDQVTKFEDHVLWHTDTSTSNVFITPAQAYNISFCQPKPKSVGNGDDADGMATATTTSSSVEPRGTINVSDIRSGKCVARISDDTESGALRDVTSLYFSEERSELYVGTRQGVLHVLAQ